jgi:ribosome-associated protein
MVIDLRKELKYRTSRSGGKGGQNVNKVSSKVEVLFDVHASALLTEEQKQIIAEKLATRITKEGILSVTETTDRSQLENKRKAVLKIHRLIREALKPVKKRKPTTISRAAKAERVNEKKHKGKIKATRGKVRSGEE